MNYDRDNFLHKNRIVAKKNTCGACLIFVGLFNKETFSNDVNDFHAF